jgi:hypothetical protein
MRIPLLVSSIALAGALSALPHGSLATALSSSQIAVSLASIKQEADAIAGGSRTSSAQYRDSARKIGVAWQKVEPAIVQQGHIVEAHFLNRSVAAFERDWKTPSAARSDAKDVSSNAVALLKIIRESPAAEPTGPAPISSGQPVPTATPTASP